jgi:hypothetical protein
MSKKGLKLGVALAAGAGAAAILTKTSQENKEIKATKAKKAEADLITATQNAANMKRTAKVFIIQTVTTKHSPVRKSQKASMTKTLIS